MFAKLEQSERKEKLYFPIHKKNSNLETKDLVVVAIMLCLAIVFDLFTSYLLPTLPLGGSISLKYIPLIFVALLYRPSLSLLCNLAFSLLCILYTKSAFIVNAWSYILDYFIPINCIILLAFTKKITNIKSFSSIFYIIFVPSLIMWISQTLGGVLVWNVLFPTAMWPGLNTVAYSATYNFINVFIMSFPVLLLLFQPINLVISKIAN
ncbi:energy-coupled thiamine transporter ThiT [Spiroplasma endosymbiont of Anurida maritima]|uniref:energy-coupled thiamine transporter ThiT n=1 Tax=Spiroplasma endosymbiont of Anurida maritima TaxID=2967972 RepID=UPI0036D3D0B3